MKFMLRFATALAASFLLVQATALACHCGVCTKTASATVIGPDYPAAGVPVTYEVKLDCQSWWQQFYAGSGMLTCGVVTSLVDTLYGGDLLSTVGSPYFFGPDAGNPDATFTYTINFTWDMCKQLGGAPEADGSIRVTNHVAATGASWGSPSFECEQEIKCVPPRTGQGCSRTPGYWKTHSNHGPASYDATWATILPAGADSPFFNAPLGLGTQTYFEVLWTDSAGGNAYYILARAYIAAKLNVLAGASTVDEVDDAISYAETVFFPNRGPNSVLTKQERSVALAWATVLDNYNNGLIGPGHCE